MNVDICVLNLTHLPAPENAKPKPLSIGHLWSKVTKTEITNPREIPAKPQRLILYIVGHAVPDAVMIDGEPLSEAKLVDMIEDARRDKPTLIIWDFCFARSFEKIDKHSWKGKPYVHIFACQPYEQAWHTGAGTEPRYQTLFSLALEGALSDGVADWEDLESKLEARLGRVQRPSILHPLEPSDFGILHPREDASAP